MAIEKVGDYVVGGFDRDGIPTKEGEFVGKQLQVDAIRQLYASHAGREGKTLEDIVGPLVKKKDEPVKQAGKKTRKPRTPKQPKLPPVKAQEGDVYRPLTLEDLRDEVESPVEQPQPKEEYFQAPSSQQETIVQTAPRLNVFFTNDFGSIKVKVRDVLTPDELTIVLVFENEDAVTFFPKLNEVLEVTLPDGTTSKVLYTGILFTWTDHTQQVMIVHRLPEDYEFTIDRVSTTGNDVTAPTGEDQPTE